VRPLRNPRPAKADGGDGAAGKVLAPDRGNLKRKRRFIMARYGRVTFSVSYVVDLDDEEMVDEAREMLAEDVQDVIRYRESWAAIDVAPDATATEADIHDYLIERREDRRAEAAT